MLAEMKQLMNQFTEFGINHLPVAGNVQVGLTESLPESFLTNFDAGDDFPHELLEVFRKSNGLTIQSFASDNATIESRLTIFDWDTFGDIDEMHEDMGFVDKFEGVYTVGTYNDLLVLVDTLGIHGEGKQAVFLIEKQNIMETPRFTGAKNLRELIERALRDDAIA
jgi:hypothetical protein